MLSFHLRLEDETPAHVYVGVFAGKLPGSRGKCGVLTMKPEEWEEFQEIAVAGGKLRGTVVELSVLARRSGGGWADEPLPVRPSAAADPPSP